MRYRNWIDVHNSYKNFLGDILPNKVSVYLMIDGPYILLTSSKGSGQILNFIRATKLDKSTTTLVEIFNFYNISTYKIQEVYGGQLDICL